MGWAKQHWKRLGVATAVVVILAAAGIPYLYIHVIEGKAPPPLALTSSPTANTTQAATASGPVAGTYQVSTGSLAGYRVNEVLAGQHTTAVGRTNKVTGSLIIKGKQVTAATFTVDMASVTSDRSQRDGQFRGRIMDVAQYPTGTFTLTEPVALIGIPKAGTVIHVSAVGNLTLHGTTKQITMPLSAERTASGIQVDGTATIAYGDYGIDNPSFGGFVSVGNSGAFEVLLDLTRATGK